MAELNIQIAMHFKFDPTKDEVKIPEEIMCTTAIGTDIVPVKMKSSALGAKTCENLLIKMKALADKARRPAKKVEAKEEVKAGENEGDQGGLF